MKLIKPSPAENRIRKCIFLLFILMSILQFSRCYKDETPKPFPPVQHCPGIPIVEYEGEEYPTVLINNRCWLAKNLNIGTMLADCTQMTNNGIIEKYCYGSDSTNCDIYGGLYQWDEMMQYTNEEGFRGICPGGWHIPTNREFVELFLYCDDLWLYLITNLGGHWGSGFTNSEYHNLTGFSALPGGWSWIEGDRYVNIHEKAGFWSSRSIDDSVAIVFGLPDFIELDNQTFFKSAGFSVRCIKDE